MTRILYLAPVDWHSVRQRPQQLVVRLARRFDVTYVDPVGLRSIRPGDLGRLWRRAAKSRQAPEVPLIRPRYIPLIGRRWLDRMNHRWLLRQLADQFDFGGEDWILWLSTPSLLAEALLEHASPKLVVYDCMDRYAAFHRGIARERIERAEAAVVGRADVVFASSLGLAERLERFKEATLLPNGVEVDHFGVGRGPMPAWKERTSGPIVGFYGTIGDWLDFDLLSYLAGHRPAWSFVFAGPLESRQFERLRKLTNVHYLGVIAYEKLPQHAAWFDVGLVPFRLNALTRYVHPIKALEYLALGLPVVSTALCDLAGLANVIRFASTSEDWLKALDDALSAQSPGEQAKACRRQAAARHDWGNRVETIVARLSEHREQSELAHVRSRPAETIGTSGPSTQDWQAAKGGLICTGL